MEASDKHCLDILDIVASLMQVPDMATIDLSHMHDRIIVTITDVKGQMVFTDEFTGVNSISLDLSKYESGTYFVKLEEVKSSVVIQLVKE
ncbi:MAG: T9SS type A sorting domain-containing protein [Crocinitomicaceae bacterium]|nr:T9SS type A sorting domain-containing protein [Crocinitomicaceae bacterium]